MRAFFTYLRSILDLLLPPRKTERIVLNLHFEDLERLEKRVLIGKVESLLSYADPTVRAVIWECKYYDSSVAAQLLGRLLTNALPGICDESLSFAPLLIPIPLHPHRLKDRGYNQVERVTDIASNNTLDLVSHAPQALIRIKDTPRQTTLKRDARLRNMENAFEVPTPQLVTGRVCILVDDVVTTGTTLEAAAESLRRAGAREVICLALARS